MLNDKQKQFCLEYIKEKFNATKAYLNVYPDCTEDNARKSASRLLTTNADVQEEVAQLIEKNYAKQEMSVEKAFALMVKHATYDIKEVLKNQQIEDEDTAGNKYIRDFVSLRNWDDVDGTLISEIKQTKDGIQVKLPDRQRALDMIGKHFAMFTEKQQVEAKGEWKITIEKKYAEDEKST